MYDLTKQGFNYQPFGLQLKNKNSSRKLCFHVLLGGGLEWQGHTIFDLGWQ